MVKEGDGHRGCLQQALADGLEPEFSRQCAQALGERSLFAGCSWAHSSSHCTMPLV